MINLNYAIEILILQRATLQNQLNIVTDEKYQRLTEVKQTDVNSLTNAINQLNTAIDLLQKAEQECTEKK